MAREARDDACKRLCADRDPGIETRRRTTATITADGNTFEVLARLARIVGLTVWDEQLDVVH